MRTPSHLIALVVAALSLWSGPASAQLLAPYKDALFGYPPLTASADGGRHFTFAYDARRDIHGRDEIPERRAKREYVDSRVRGSQRELNLQTEHGRIPHVAVGRERDARFIVVYLYGQGGNRHQGMNDFTFGGNFNRIKNLAVANGGLYLTLDFSNFEAAGAWQVSTLLRNYGALSPGARIYIACGSMGGALCWRLAEDEALVARLGGLVLLGSIWNERFLSSAAFARRVPVLFGHGGNDSVFPVERQEAFFRAILARAPDYPARFMRFETGSHGTPIRMTDWRDTLNWMAAQR